MSATLLDPDQVTVALDGSSICFSEEVMIGIPIPTPVIIHKAKIKTVLNLLIKAKR